MVSSPVSTDGDQRPPGRPTSNKLFSILFDDTFRLLSPSSMADYQVRRRDRFGPVFSTNIFFRPAVFCTDETSLQQVASEEVTKDVRQFFPPHHQRLFGPSSLLVTSGAEHDRLRRLIQPALSPKMMQSYQPLLETAMDALLADWQQNCTDSTAMVPKVRSFFIQVTLQVILGTEAAPAADLAADISIWSQGLLAAPLTFVPWSFAAKAVRARNRIVDRIMVLMDRNTGEGLMGRLLEARDESQEALSRSAIIDNLLTILFAGSDTTASATISLWKVLAERPDLKQQLAAADDQTIRAMVEQVLEHYPPAPFAMRETQADLRIGDYRIPAGWLIAYGFAGSLLGGDGPSDWIATKVEEAVDPAASLAFGVGVRKCPGRFLAVLELTLLCRRLALAEFVLDPDQNLEQRYTPGLFPVDGFRVKFT